MTDTQECAGMVAGLFKIHGAAIEEVLEVVEEWRDGRSGEIYDYLTIRRSEARLDEESVSVITIDFRAKLLVNDPTHKKFLYKHTDILRRRFGNGLLVWDTSNPVWVVK